MNQTYPAATGADSLQAGACPQLLEQLLAEGSLAEEEIFRTEDGLWAARRSLADILIGRGITTFPNDRDEERRCDRFFDDWYLYAVPDGAQPVYGLFKMREQEYDAREDVPADGDTPGVTVSFIAFDPTALTDCLADPSPQRRKALNREIDRVVARRGQRHHPAMKAYFRRTEAQGPYLLARLYVEKIASLARDGRVETPVHYREMAEQAAQGKATRRRSRLPRFIEANNAAAGETVCDHRWIYLRDPVRLSQWEQLAILAAYTADTSFNAFAAEVQYHACFLVGIARIPIPGLGRSVYASAVRADMTIDDGELEGPAPFHDPDSLWVRRQRDCHGGM